MKRMMTLSATRGDRRLWARSALITAVMTLGLAACGPSESPPAEEGPSGGTAPSTDGKVVYNRGNSAEPTSMDPHLIQGTWESHIARDLYLGLMTDAADGSPIYGAAESSSTSEDGLTWTFKMREGHKWSDGTPVTADDFVFSYRRILTPATGAEYVAILYPIKNAEAVSKGEMPPEALGVEAPDERTFVIHLEYPAPFLPQMLTHQALYPVPKHLVEKYGKDWVKPEHIATNGPYMFADWRPNNFVHLVKNPYFYDKDNVRIDEVYYYPTDDRPAAVVRFENGELDSNNDFPIQQYARLTRDYPKETRAYPYILTTYTIFNTTSEPFNNRDLRMAMAMVIDREVLATQVMKTGQQPAYMLVPPGIVNYPHTAAFEWKDEPLEQRIEEARALMRKAGYGPDRHLSITYLYREGTDNRRRAVAMTAMWKAIWVDAQLMNTETKTHYANLRAGAFQIADAGWVADYNDPKNYLFLFETKSGQLNYGKYSNPEYDRLLDEADHTVDIDERGRILAQAEQIMLNDAPVIPVLFGTSRNLVANYLKGWVDNVDDRHATRFMWIDEAERKKRR